MINATAVKTIRIPILSVILHISTILGLKSPHRHLSRPSRVSAMFWFWDFKVPSVNKGLIKRSNASIDTLITVYTTIIRPVLEYACQVWHNIQQYLSEEIEKIQKRAFRIILPIQKYDEALTKTNIMSLRNRREKLCEQFFETNISNEKLKDLLPQTTLYEYELKSVPKYHNYLCRTERFKNSFLPQSIIKINSN